MEQKGKAQEALLMMLYFIFGVIIFGLIGSIVSTLLSLSSSDMLVETQSCCCCCRCPQANLDDEVIYTLEVKDDSMKVLVGEPPANPVSLSK